jgi:Zn-dependent alcohol dehydrogenase
MPDTVDDTWMCFHYLMWVAMKNAADMRAGESVAVVGTGGVGANCLQISRAFGGDKIIAIDIADDKLKAMRALGATHTINASTENVVDRIREITGIIINSLFILLYHTNTIKICIIIIHLPFTEHRFC